MKVLVATDGSAPAAVGIQLAAGIDWPAGSTVRVVTAVDTGSALFGGPWPAVAMTQASVVEAEIRAAAGRIVREAAAPLARQGLTVETALLEGRASAAVVTEAERTAADLVIVGSRGHGAIETMLLGSVTAEILDSANVPVLVARTSRIGPVVLAWDGSPAADRAATLLATWPFLRSSTIRVVTAAETTVPWWATSADPGAPALIPVILDAMDAARAEEARRNAAMTDRLRSAGLDATGEAREGDPARELLAAAAGAGAGLIVMGTHGRTGLARLALGSVARNVVNHATCNVLVVRGPAGDAGAPAAA
jgi:nucleotide-binding universal stress UspA family protein